MLFISQGKFGPLWRVYKCLARFTVFKNFWETFQVFSVSSWSPMHMEKLYDSIAWEWSYHLCERRSPISLRKVKMADFLWKQMSKVSSYVKFDFSWKISMSYLFNLMQCLFTSASKNKWETFVSITDISTVIKICWVENLYNVVLIKKSDPVPNWDCALSSVFFSVWPTYFQ